MKGPWIKLWRNVLVDQKISFLMRRYGNDIAVLWIGILVNTEDGELTCDEDILADQCALEEKRFTELKSVLIKRELITVCDGAIVVPNWKEYQEGESTERSRRCREAKKEAKKQSTDDETHGNDEATDVQRACNERQRVEVEVEVEVEEEVEAERERRAREGKIELHFEEKAQDIPPAARLLNAWWQKYIKETGRLISPGDEDRLASVKALGRLGGDIELALQCVDTYWATWRDLWFAVKSGDAKRVPGQRRPSFNFRSFATHIDECIPAENEMVSQDTEPAEVF